MEVVRVRPHRSHTRFGAVEMVHGYDRVQPMHYKKRKRVVRRRPIVVIAKPVRRRRY